LPINPELWQANKQLKKLTAKELRDLLQTSITSLRESDFSTANLTERLNILLESTNQKPAILFSLIRVATTNAPASPGLAETLAVLGKDVAMRRMAAMQAYLETNE
jgi:glutamyl-tRNA synthetase